MNTTQIYKVEKAHILELRLKDLNILVLFRSTIGIFLRLILILAFIITIFTVITSNTNYLFGIRSYTVLTGSMEPNIPVGSFIFSMKNLGYNVGDVITYKISGETLITHRIVEIQNNGEVLYLTKGDANTVPDSTYITVDKIVGKTYFSLPLIGQISGMLKTPQGLFGAVFLPAVIIVLFELWNIKKEIEKSVEDRILKRMKSQGGAHPHSQLWSESVS
jgi:signal peptidase I